MADLRDQFLDNMEALKQEAAEKTAENLKGDKPERVNPEQFTVEVQKLFKKGWEEAGGFMGDMTAESPLFAPWSRDEYIEVRGEDPVRWGRDYWDYRKEELANAALMEAFDAQKGNDCRSAHGLYGDARKTRCDALWEGPPYGDACL